MSALAEWSELAAALFCFMGAHALPARPAIRSAIVSVIGRTPYILIYSALSVGLLIWVARAAATAPFVELWPYDQGAVAIPALGMAVTCLLIVFGLTSPNPLSLGRSRGFDPRAPGVAAVVRHPVLWAALIWASSHPAVNGDLAHLIVFGAFGILAVVGMQVLDRRFIERLGAAEWETLARYTSNIPFVGLGRGAAIRVGFGTALRVIGAAVLYGGLVALHEILAGVPVPLNGI